MTDVQRLDSTKAADPLRGLGAWLSACVAHGASDLHLTPGLPPTLRVHGELESLEGVAALGGGTVGEVARALLSEAGWARLVERGQYDGAMSAADGTRFRFNVFRRQGHYAAAFRRLEDRFQTLAELGLPEGLYGLCDLADGLVVIAGPTGAGKSTTLASLLDRINRTRRAHLVTIEDPIEYLHRPDRCVINQRQVGDDVGDFNEALVAAMRQDPDVILVGEVRDLATIRTAITAAETGHLVFTTVHAGDCVGAIERLVGVFPDGEQDGIRRQLSLVLRAVVAQHLLVADGQAGGARLEGETHRPRRVVASEVLRVTQAVANLIASGKSSQVYSAMESGGGSSMQTMEQDLARLLHARLISELSATALARHPQVLRDRAAMLRRGADQGGTIDVRPVGKGGRR